MEAVTRLWNHPKIRSIPSKVGNLFSRRYLLYTNTAISVVMSCTGDSLQQHYQILQGEMTQWDLQRMHDVGFTGLVIGPFCHLWYLMLDRWFPGRTIGIVMKKLVVDQFVCSPIAISSFLLLTSFLEGKTAPQIKQELIEKGKTLYTAEWIVWPPAQIINFYFLPTRYRVLFDNSVSFGFDWYFSFVKYGHRYIKAGAPNLESDNSNNSEDKLTQVTKSRYQIGGSHVPFLHIQAADIVQLKQDMFHINSKRWWQKWHDRSFQQSGTVDHETFEVEKQRSSEDIND
ncbi:mpv17-like protein 2 [Dreissena polymorpha]|uniref:Mpv17-like protein 2 n=1 Tax=Dreissena polymorpha TaxID=45954 RepID=A0A9D4E629_DREPO|nr:mpv17-like protein 2 [Dreissena polymorpha]XP_052233859.1 mpv17-like protein 2 [Dreissena polymorpha]KAH3772575.1 hypothetical protein DPMN_173916 [Dreissena polymorpha]